VDSVHTLAIIAYAIAGILMIGAILLQEGKGGGLAALGATPAASAFGASNPLRRLTVVLAIVFFLLAGFLSYVGRSEKLVGEEEDDKTEKTGESGKAGEKPDAKAGESGKAGEKPGAKTGESGKAGEKPDAKAGESGKKPDAKAGESDAKAGESDAKAGGPGKGDE